MYVGGWWLAVEREEVRGAGRAAGGSSIALAGRGHSGHPPYLPPFFAFPPESARSPACFSSKSIQITGLAKFLLFQNVFQPFLVSLTIPSRLKKCKKIDRRVCEVSGQCQLSGHYGCSTTRFRLGWRAKLCFSDTIVGSASSICIGRPLKCLSCRCAGFYMCRRQSASDIRAGGCR